MLRKKREAEATVENAVAPASEGFPTFSPAFVAEVGGCRDIGSFQDLLERKGLWLNRNAAEGVFSYLHSMANRKLDDEELVPVVGGVNVLAADAQVVSTLQILADQLNGR